MNEQPSQRLDKWLWAARFFKTRTSAAEAVAGGKVQVDGDRVKPARQVRAGSRLEIRRGTVAWEVVVVGVSSRRLPAREAVALYEESEARRERREEEAARARARRVRPFAKHKSQERVLGGKAMSESLEMHWIRVQHANSE